MSAVVNFEFLDGSKVEHVELNYAQWQEMYRSGKWDGKPIWFLEVEKKHQDKGPDRIKFL